MSEVLLLVLVAVAGGLGAALRLVVDGTIGRLIHPVGLAGTSVVNVTGSFALGLVTGLALAHVLPGPWTIVAGTGFLGGYTTFSTAAVEAVRLLQARRYRAAGVLVLGSLVGSILAAGAGVWIGSL